MSSEARPISSWPAPVRSRALSRRFGFRVAVILNLLLLVLVNGAPGWRALPFLSAEAGEVLLLLNLSLILWIIGNVVNVIFDHRWIRAVGEFFGSAAAFTWLTQVWNVFPFAVDDPAVDWALIVEVVIGFAIVGCFASMVVQAVTLIRIGVAGATTSGIAADSRAKNLLIPPWGICNHG